MEFDCEKLIRVTLEIEHRDEGFHTKIEEAAEWDSSKACLPWCVGSDVFYALKRLFPDAKDFKDAMSCITDAYSGWLKDRGESH